jgi:hypothetical protein
MQSPWYKDDKPYSKRERCGCVTHHTDTGNPYGTTKNTVYCKEHDPYISEYDKEMYKNKKLKEELEKERVYAEQAAANKKKKAEENEKAQKIRAENEELQRQIDAYRKSHK